MDVQSEGCGALRLPDFFILGAAKGGTSSLFRYLGEHPGIFAPEEKEPWFFSFPTPDMDGAPVPNLSGAVTDLADYARLFAGCGDDQITFEASPSYLFTPGVSIPKLKTVYTPAVADRLKFFILLRNPVDRAWSMYWTFGRVLLEDREFEDAIRPEVIEARRQAGQKLFFDYIGAGRYCDQIRAYQEAFPRENIRIILFDDLTRDTARVVRECYEFLGVDPDFTPDTGTVYNFSGKPKHRGLIRMLTADSPLKSAFKSLVSVERRRQLKRLIGKRVLEKTQMKPETRRQLIETYRGEILELQDMLGRDLTHWLR